MVMSTQRSTLCVRLQTDTKRNEVFRMVTLKYDISQWKIAFWVCFGVYMFGAVTYLFMGIGELQPWANPELQAEACQRSWEEGLRWPAILPVRLQ